MTIYDVMDWAKAHECEHMELVPFCLNFELEDGSINVELVEGIRNHAEKIGLPLSIFSLNADVLKETEEERQAEIARIKKFIDIAHTVSYTHLDVYKRQVQHRQHQLPHTTHEKRSAKLRGR